MRWNECGPDRSQKVLFLFVVKIRSVNDGSDGSTVGVRTAYFYLVRSISETEIDCNKVVRRPIDNFATSFAEETDVGSKAICL